jgi:hypothetical protein
MTHLSTNCRKFIFYIFQKFETFVLSHSFINVSHFFRLIFVIFHISHQQMLDISHVTLYCIDVRICKFRNGRFIMQYSLSSVIIKNNVVCRYCKKRPGVIYVKTPRKNPVAHKILRRIFNSFRPKSGNH